MQERSRDAGHSRNLGMPRGETFDSHLASARADALLEAWVTKQANHCAVERMIEGLLVIIGCSRVAIVLGCAFSAILPADAATLPNQFCRKDDPPPRSRSVGRRSRW
jgi:hypothetical protein